MTRDWMAIARPTISSPPGRLGVAERGVPMIMAGGSFSDMAALQRFLAAGYHSPGDELRPDTDLGGAVDDANLHVEMIRRAASRKFVARVPRVPQLSR